MANHSTRKSRRANRARVLEVRVMSPRIAWLKTLRVAGQLAKFTAILGVLAALGWGIWGGVQRAFYQNPDFRLQVIDLNPNPVMDVSGFAEVAKINLTSSLFQFDLAKIVTTLKSQPAIADARAERHLPGTLMIRVTPRVPRAWIACPAAGVAAERHVGALLVDQAGVAYPCPELQLETALHLPIIILPPAEAPLLGNAQVVSQPELKHCFHLLDAACKADAEAIQWIESIRQTTAWSLELTTRQGTVATFGLGDHQRQIASLQAANDHASAKGYSIATINLIPKYNIPITVRDETASTPRPLPPEELSPAEQRNHRQARDLSTLLNRN
jgi:POTRA domain, FtsQ-type